MGHHTKLPPIKERLRAHSSVVTAYFREGDREPTTHIVILVPVVLDPVHDDLAVTLLHLFEQAEGLGKLLRPEPVGALLRDELLVSGLVERNGGAGKSSGGARQVEW